MMATSRKTTSKKATASKAAAKKKTAKTAKKAKAPASKAARAKKKTGNKMTSAKTKAPSSGSAKAKATTKKTATKKAAKKAVAKAPAKPAKPPKPKKPAVDPELLKVIRDALVRQRNELMSVMQTTQAQLAQKDGDLADISDRASDGFEDELALGLMKIEAAQIDDIEAAIQRVDDGVYGLCADCGKLIPRKRLEVLPFAQRCLDCEGVRERKARIQDRSDEDD
ncbi:MAG: TraR/DksA C4-type zinc finger protein [Phycisphaerales bacterium]|nr:TraR/DksA C4-type zinc finger protein [Phycisphaerales bacterium]